MSSRGTVPAWVIEKQQKQIALKREADRKKLVRQQITKVASVVRAQMSGLNNEEINTWAKEEMEFVQHTIDSTVSMVDADVDFVLKRLHKSIAILEQVQSLAESREREHQRKVEAKQTAYNAAVETVKYIRLELTQTSSEEAHTRLMNDLFDVNDKLENATVEEVTKAVEAIESEAIQLREQDHQAAVDEELRRYIISSVVRVMSELGFVVGKPKLLRESGNVAVIGTLSSGRTIRFDVRASGEMEFDMDGFKDRTCSESLDEVLLLMEERFGVESGPVQHNWKNPDRISRGARAFQRAAILEPWEGEDNDGMETNGAPRGWIRRCLILYGNVRDVWQLRRTYAAPAEAVREQPGRVHRSGTWDHIDGLSFPTSSQLSTFNDLVQGSSLVEEDGDDYDIDFGDETQNDGGAAAGLH